ncbi:cysteine desulfurase [Brevibacillus agri]|uniref:cysteine desulfurase n=1 Tax=Brevibacillus agri TaxID=51101 RepID=A0A3M8AUF9_9BACL|nr:MULTISPECIES: cysteine desulfurase family protein [Brevibacillus]EJL43781.1 cysteine desulfurase family protein [Brevibacillus sp. CF112]MBG9564210.1 cysteine desulfurase [Brevibacillus agri]MBY0053208.1 cysteine desulfurase [Brevibacillus agri]MCG5250655.1 cysteine desulfurase [Brevibacillus agri]MDN4092628.1 cysteine desulfurase family protein [Brevibacillus agri]
MSDMLYFDHAATTPVHPRVLAAMTPYLTQVFGNPSSVHAAGREARKALEQARDAIASFMDADPQSLIFTSGGTEADNMAVIGGAMAQRERGRHVITTQIEHHAVLHACEYLEQAGFEVTYLPVDKTGSVRLEDVKQAVRPDTVLVSIMYGNNEVGTIQPIEEIGVFLQEKGIIFHTDAVQAFGVLPIRARQLPVDMLSVSAHKINGPKGVGALYLGRKVPVSPILHGGSQERKRRAGTENLAGIVGFAEATKVATEEMADRVAKYEQMKAAMRAVWEEAGIAFHVNGHPTNVLPHILNVSFPGVHTETMLMNLDLARIAAASGSACTSGSLELSHVLVAMQLEDEIARSAIRFSFGITNTVEEARQAAQTVAQIVNRLVRSK